MHDSAAVRLGGSVYLFGGGTNAGTQSDAIVRVPAAGGNATVVGRLPAPSSDQAAAAIGRTAYVVGGYTGSRWLQTIVAWRPGSAARVVARLPFTLRYAAVTTVGGRLMIAGGSLENGTASSAVLAYRPGRGVIRIGRLPAPTTHAAAAALGRVAYVIGGRGAAVDSRPGESSRSTPPRDASGRPARSRRPRSDLAAVALDGRILLAGGRTAAGTSAGLSTLVAAPAERTHVARRAAPATSARGVYAYDGANRLTGAARLAKPLVYVPNSESDTVDVIDPRTYQVDRALRRRRAPAARRPGLGPADALRHERHGQQPDADRPAHREAGAADIPVDDPYNMYFTPDGRYAIVVAERLRRLDFRDAHTFRAAPLLPVPCAGIDHMDFTADGRFACSRAASSRASWSWSTSRASESCGTIDLPDGPAGMPQDVKLSPDGSIFYVADMHAGGAVGGRRASYRVLGFLATGAGAHGLYPSRDGKLLYVTNRGEGTISVLDFGTRQGGREVADPRRRQPGHGRRLGRRQGALALRPLRRRGLRDLDHDGTAPRPDPVGAGPHGLCVWPQPGRYSLGHTGILR